METRKDLLDRVQNVLADFLPGDLVLERKGDVLCVSLSEKYKQEFEGRARQE